MSRGIVIAGVLLLAGCADPMTQSDGIWPTAGHAQRRNLSSQAIGYYGDSRPGAHGVRAAKVIQRYQTGNQTEPAAAEAEPSPVAQ